MIRMVSPEPFQSLSEIAIARVAVSLSLSLSLSPRGGRAA